MTATELEFTSEVEVSLVDHSGSDLSIAKAAWVSTQDPTNSPEAMHTDQELSDKMGGLLGFLLKNRHGTPFEHNSMTFRVSAPLFVWREHQRHRVGFCLAGDTQITLCSPDGRSLRQKTIAEIWEHWHLGVPDSMPGYRGRGYSWNENDQRWKVQAKRDGKYEPTKLFLTEQEAVDEVQRRRSEVAPSERRRKLPSTRNLHLRVLNEDTLEQEVGTILDVVKSGPKQLYLLTTESGLEVRASADHQIFTSSGWKSLGNLAVGDYVYRAGKIARGTARTIPKSLRQAIGLWTTQQRESLINYEDCCYLCDGTFLRDELELDHVVPVVVDLAKALDTNNLKPACRDCHRSKTTSEQCLPDRVGCVSGARADRVVSIALSVIDETYDLVVDEPWHNFFANGLVVHNSYNEESGRYKKLDPKFYIPSEDRALVQKGKPGHYEYVAGTESQYDFVVNSVKSSVKESYWRYEAMLGIGVAREVARIALPLNIFSTCYVTCNARSLMSFLALRTKSENSHFPSYPQREIEMVAEKYEEIFAELFPITYSKFDEFGRVSP